MKQARERQVSDNIKRENYEEEKINQELKWREEEKMFVAKIYEAIKLTHP